MAIPTPWMPLLIEQKWLTPDKIGRFAAATPILGTLLLMFLTSFLERGSDAAFTLALLLLIPQIILYFFFVDALTLPTPGSALGRFIWRGSLAGLIYGALAGLIIGMGIGIFVGIFVGLIWGFAYTLIYLPILGWVVNISRIPAHDTPNRLFLAVSIWFGTLLTIASVIAVDAFAGQLFLWPVQFLGVALILTSIARDLRLRSVLRKLYDGKLPGMELAPLAGKPSKIELDLLPLVSGNDAIYDAVVICKDTQEDGPFRSSQSETTLALCPLDREAAMNFINQRIGWGILGLSFMLCIVWVAWAGR
jgi:hypothetical protein